MRYFIHIGYDGSNYRGWQRQKRSGNTVQEVIEQTLVQLFKKKVTAYGCGRTDAGVHASQYVFHINLDEAPSFDLKFRLNKNLPDSIAVFEIIEVNLDQHSRYDALSRTYDYFIHLKKDPILSRFSTYYDHAVLNIDLMQRATTLIRSTQDFKPLCKQPDLHHDTICQITKCELFANRTQGRLRFTITSNRFLQGMVRYCVFFLLQIGSDKTSLDEFERILNQKTIDFKKRRAQAHGLFLSQITYPFITLNDSYSFVERLKTGLE